LCGVVGGTRNSLRHRETGTGLEGDFWSLEEEVDGLEGNFRTDGGGLGHGEERRLTGAVATQGNLSCEREGRAGVHRNAGQLAFGERRANAASGTWGNLGCVSAKTGALGEVFVERRQVTQARRPSNRTRSEARPGEAPPSHAWRGLVVCSGPVRRLFVAARQLISDAPRQLISGAPRQLISGARRPRCGSGCATCAPGTASCGPARRRPRRPPRSRRSPSSGAPRPGATSHSTASSASGRRC
jgi:hypothetical protein